MPNFKLENNVPNYYVDESRDFQLLCRVLDIYLKGCLSKSSYIPYQLDLDKCSEQLLYAIANMQGFTTNIYIPPNILRNILKVFPYCIKRKGTKEAIEVASYAVLSTDKLIYYILVEVDSNTGNQETSYTVTITCNSQSTYIPYLEEVLKFLVPAGWNIKYRLLKTLSKTTDTTKIKITNTISRLSGITGKIISIEPLKPAFENNGFTAETKSGVYSRIGFAKVIRSRTTNELFSNEGYVSETYKPEGAEKPKFIDLLDEINNTTTFIGNNIMGFGDSIEGGEQN